MLADSQTLELAWRSYQSGNLSLAEQIYRQVLTVDPGNAVAWCILGVVCRVQGKLAEAQACLRQALQLNPGMSEAHNNLGNVYLDQGQLDEAVVCYEHVLRLCPNEPLAHNNLGTAYRWQGKSEQAAAWYRKALALQPNLAEVCYNLGIVLQEQGKNEEAAVSYRQALSLKPHVAQVHNNLGNVLLQQGRREEAASCYRQALCLQPNFAAAHHGLGNVLLEQGKLDEAETCFRAALRCQPENAEAHCNLIEVLQKQGRIEEALDCCREALRSRPDDMLAHSPREVASAQQEKFHEAVLRTALLLKPDYAEAHNYLGVILSRQGQADQAANCFRRAVHYKSDYAEAFHNLGATLLEQGHLQEALTQLSAAVLVKPDYAEAHKSLGLALAMNGSLEEAWREYEWRWRCKEFMRWILPQPRWDGTGFQGKTILLHAEQGLGDALQFIRYAPLVKQRGGTVLVACQPPLLRLLQTCPGIDRLVPRGSELPPFDIQTPLLSLPGLFRTTLATIPAQVPYLSAKAELVEDWHRALEAVRGLRVGITWQGDSRYPKDRLRSFPLSHFSRLTRLKGIQLVSLQKGQGVSQMAALEEPFPLLDLGAGLDEASGPFMDTAAVMKNLDLVVTADTAVAHLAGALGVPVWVALAFSSDWRWMLYREDSPWYPTMRLFRQTEPGNWSGVFERLEVELEKKIAATCRVPR